MTDSMSLWERVAASEAAIRTPLSIQARFEVWLATAEGQYVKREVLRKANEIRRRGFSHYGIKAIMETIRWDRNLALGPNDGFKVNDHYTSRLVRLLIEEQPDLDGFFETRELRA